MPSITLGGIGLLGETYLPSCLNKIWHSSASSSAHLRAEIRSELGDPVNRRIDFCSTSFDAWRPRHVERLLGGFLVQLAESF